MGRGVEDGDDLVRHHAVLGVIGDALELDLLVAGEDRRIHAPRMAELDKREPALRIYGQPHNVAVNHTPRQSSWRAHTPIDPRRSLELQLCGGPEPFVQFLVRTGEHEF